MRWSYVITNAPHCELKVRMATPVYRHSCMYGRETLLTYLIAGLEKDMAFGS